jgi:hypothetical protein
MLVSGSDDGRWQMLMGGWGMASHAFSARRQKETGYTLIYAVLCAGWPVSREQLQTIEALAGATTPACTVLETAGLEKLTVVQLVKDFPGFYARWRFIAEYTGDSHWILY